MKPLISVLMPNYNCEKYLLDAIESILKQTYSQFELIIIDDCSSDNSWKIIQKYAKKDKRIKAFQNKQNSGVTVTLNNGLKHCNGKYIARMDSDDISDLERFEKQIRLLEKKKADICSTNLIMFNESGIIGKRKYNPNISSVILCESPIAHATVMLKKELFDKYGHYNPRFNSAEDYDLWLRFYSQNASFVLVDEFLYKYRQHSSMVKNIATKKTIRTTIAVKMNAWRNYGVTFGMKGWVRIGMEAILLLLPRTIILKLFYLVKGKR